MPDKPGMLNGNAKNPGLAWPEELDPPSPGILGSWKPPRPPDPKEANDGNCQPPCWAIIWFEIICKLVKL